MAEFLNLQSNIENNIDDRFDFGSICKIWLKIDLWSIEDSARLISGIPPQSIADEEDIKSNTAYKVNLEIITGCLGKSLTYSMNKFQEKPRGDGAFINGGFFVLSPKVIERIEDDTTVWEQEPLTSLAADNELMAFKHKGFWQPMDTLRDKVYLEKLLRDNKAVWKKWK